jgi:hypothetical protein
MGPKLGSSAAYAIGGIALVAAASAEHRYPWLHLAEPWRLTLGVAAVPSIAIACLVFTFSEPPRRTLSNASKAIDQAGAMAFLIESRRLMIPLVIGFCAIVICGQSLISWVPTYIHRQFDWSPAAYGPILGAISMAGALTLVLKGMIMDWLFARGMRDVHVRFYTWLLAGTLPLAAAVFLVHSKLLFLVFYAAVSVVTLPFVAYFTVAIQMVTPPVLRGRVIAITSIPLVLVGGLGPPLVGALTDFVFHDELKIGWSLALTMVTMIPVALVCLRYCLPLLGGAVERNAEAIA